jgi:rubrerythrin
VKNFSFKTEKGKIMSENTLNDLLDVAIKAEVKAQKFYEEASIKFSDPKVQNFFRSLVNEEKKHERILLNIKEMEIYDGSVAVKEDILEDARDAHEAENAKLSGDDQLEQIYEVALKREIKAHNTYKHIADLSQNEEIKALFENLADDELDHHKRIEMKYHAQTGQMGYEA